MMSLPRRRSSSFEVVHPFVCTPPISAFSCFIPLGNHFFLVLSAEKALYHLEKEHELVKGEGQIGGRTIAIKGLLVPV